MVEPIPTDVQVDDVVDFGTILGGRHWWTGYRARQS